ncbi:hypothetical protein VB735_30135 [Halotia wernerae UHCC 0503]|nr:hypothetical protein [Halotia wernerae UHCC 0503]
MTAKVEHGLNKSDHIPPLESGPQLNLHSLCDRSAVGYVLDLGQKFIQCGY